MQQALWPGSRYGRIIEAATRLGALRDAIGYGIDIGIDFHGRVHKAMSKQLVKGLSHFGPCSLRSRCFPRIMRRCLSYLAIPQCQSRLASACLLAGSSGIYSPLVRSILFKARSEPCRWDLGVPQDRCHGPAYDVAVAPHCPLGPIALAASLQLDFCTPNAFIQEQSLGIHYNQGSDVLDYLDDPKVFAYDQGFVPLMTAPGLGITINEERVRAAAAVGHRWRNPIWRTEDGGCDELVV